MHECKASLFGFIVGDALGVPVEFISREVLKKNRIINMIENPSRRTTIGYWSDDTALTLCTIKSITEFKDINYEDMIERFFQWFKYGTLAVDKKCFGIGKTTLKAMNNYMKYGYPDYLTINIANPNDRGNGSLMRILPVALFLYNKDDLTLEEKCFVIEKVSELTHQDIIAKRACVFYSLLVFKLLDGQQFIKAYHLAIADFKDLFQNQNHAEFKRVLTGEIHDLKEDEIESTGYVIHTLEACIWCVANHRTYKDIVLSAVNLGNDTDTIAALSGGLAGLFVELESIPSHWVNKLREKEVLDTLIKIFVSFVSLNNLN